MVMQHLDEVFFEGHAVPILKFLLLISDDLSREVQVEAMLVIDEDSC